MKKLMLFMLAMMLGIVAANAQGTGTVVVADGTATNSYVPVYGSYTDDFLRCQTIYPESMLTDIAGSEIQGLTYYMSSAASPWSGSFDGTFVIKLGTTTKTAFESGDEWIDVTSFTTVYEGSIDFSASATVVINFGTTYTYTGGNLVIEVGQTSESSGYASTSFYGTSTTGASLQYYNGTSFAQIVGTVRNFMPKTGFIVPVSCVSPTLGTITPEARAAAVAWTENGSATAWQLKLNDGEWLDVTENPYTLTSLTPETAYNLQLRSNCGGGDFSIPVSSSFTTLVSCPAPTALTATAAETSLELTWVENGSATEWLMKVDDGSDQPVTSPYTLTGLTANTAYAIQIRALCGVGDTSSAVSGTFRTLCGFEAVPYSEDFEGISSGIPDCWDQEASNPTSSKWDFSSTGNSGNGLVFGDWSGYNSRLILPVVDCSSLTADGQLSFFFKNPSISNGKYAHLALYYRTSSTGEWTAIDESAFAAANEDWTNVDVILPNSANAPYYQVSFMATGEDTYPRVYAYLDDINIGEAPACARPSNLTAEAAETSLTLSWNENGSATKWVVKVGDGAWTETTQNPYTINDLTANTEYAVSVRAFCDPDTSEAVSGTFRTLCGVFTSTDLPYFEGFEGDISCWEQENINGNTMWEVDGLYSYYDATAYEGAEYYGINGDGAETRLISPVFNLAGIDNVTLKLAHVQPSYYGYYQDNLTIEYRLSSTGEWQTLATYTDDITEWQSESFDIPNPGATFQFAFRAQLNDANGVGIDSVSLSSGSAPQPTCDVPTALAAGNVTANSAVITWNGTAAQYEVELNGQSSTVNTNSYTAQGLTAATAYTVRVRALCDGGLTSDWTSTVNFTTLDNGGGQPGDCGMPTNVAVSNVTTNSAVVTWDAPAQEEGFEGDWNLEMGDEDSVHTTITLNQTLHTILTMLGQNIEDVDEEVSVAGTQVPVTIAQGAGNQMNISGSFDMMMYGVDEPVTFHFNTTGTVTENGMNIETANISESVAIMGSMNIDYTGTVSFEQPTELPEDGVLTIGIASMNITGYGDTVIYGQTGTVNISMTASDIEAAGMRAGAGNSEPTYEVMITNTASGVENTYASATRTYSAEGLTAATAYTAKVRTVCGEGNYSEWSTAVPFTTLDNGDTPVECDVPTNIVIDQESINTPYAALITWNGTASQYEIEITGGEQPVTTTVSTNSYTFNGVASTTYSVRVRAICDGGVTSDWSATQSFTTPNGGEPQGIDDVNASYSVSVYPNPATNHVTVSVEGLTGKAQVSVVDMTGRTVMSSAMEGDAMQLNVTKLAQGTYFVRIEGENISTVRKLVVK